MFDKNFEDMCILLVMIRKYIKYEWGGYFIWKLLLFDLLNIYIEMSDVMVCICMM